MERRGRRVVASVVALGVVAGVVLLAARAHSQPVAPIRETRYAAWVPPGEYTAFVICSSGDERRWAVTLATRTAQVPVIVRPGENVVVPFEGGWCVKATDEVRLLSSLVPFDDAAIYNKVGEEPRFVLSAWGITADGPVAFAYRGAE